MFDLGNVTYRQSMTLSGTEKISKLAESYHFYLSAETSFKEVDGSDSINSADAGVMIARHLIRHGTLDDLSSAR